MAKMKCPSCGQPFNGKRCRNCMYEVFTEEITHGLHTHEGEPLVIDAPTRRPIQRKNPLTWDRRTRKRSTASPLVGIAVALVIALAVPLAEWVGDNLSPKEAVRPELDSPEWVWSLEPEPIPETLSDLIDQAIENAAGEAPQPDVQTPDWWDTGMVLLDSGDLRVVADWQDGDGFSGQIAVAVENNTDMDVWLDLDDLVVNGFSMQYGDVYAEAEPGQTGTGYFYLDEAEVMDAGITQFQEISFRLDVIDDESYETVDSRPVVLYPECDPDYVQKVADGGAELVNRDGVRILYQGGIPDYSTPEDPSFGSLRLYLENGTDYPLAFYAPQGTVNGKEADLFLWAEVEPHSRAIVRVSLYDVYNLGMTDWSELKQATLDLEVARQDGEPYLTGLSPVSFAIDEG